MFNERTALEKIFSNLEAARERRYKQYLDEIKAIEDQQEKLLADLRRIDEESHIHSELIEQKKEEARATADVKKRLAAMDQSLVPPLSKDEAIAKKYGEDQEQPKPERKGIPERATRAVYEDGKKIYPDGREAYQCYYICPKCRDKGKVFIPVNTKSAYCKACNKTMPAKFATSKGFPHRDDFGNYFVAGDFERVEDREKRIAIPPNPVDEALARYEAERAAKEAERKAKQEAAATFGDDETAIEKAFKESSKYTLN